MPAVSKAETLQSHLNRCVTYSYKNNGLNSHKQKYTEYFIEMIWLNIKTVIRTIKRRI
jgi:hypothetical protein